MNDSPENKIDTATLLANLKKKANQKVSPVETALVVPGVDSVKSADIVQVEKDLETVQVNLPELPAAEVPKVKEKAEYQQYTASRVSTCLITPTGKRINFSNYQYYTKDPEIIRYLDKEITAGLKGLIKGKVLTASELNPEAAKKREIIEEFKVSQEGREFGSTKPESERTTALSSDQVAN